MKLKIEIDMDNQAFEEDPLSEVREILLPWIGTAHRDRFSSHATTGQPVEWSLRDHNGNRCGFARVEESPAGPGINPATGKPFKAAPWETQ